MSIRDLNGASISQAEAKEIINQVLAMSTEKEFKGATPQGQEINAMTFTLPQNIQDAQDYERTLRNHGDSNRAGQFAQGFLGVIAQKLIYHTILTAPNASEFDFLERFRGENLDFGTSKEFTATQMSGYQLLNQEEFVPKGTTKSTVIGQINSFLTPQGALNPESKAFMVQFCTSIQSYATKEYMLSDVKLQQFISTIRDSVVNGAKLYLYNLVMNQIKDGITNASTTPDGTKWTLINGTATNMFDACIEICSHIKKLTKLGNEYQLVKHKHASQNWVRAASHNDLTWIWSIENDEKASRGIKSQLYHYKLWDPKNSINEANVYTPYKKITLPDLTTSKANNYPTLTNELWIDNNTVVILENGAIEFNLVWEKNETQYYTNNMTLQITYNLAGMINPINVKRGFVYKNSNLSVDPSST